MSGQMAAQRLQPILKPIFKLFRVSNFEELVRRLLKIVFTILLLTPLILLPLYFFFYTLLHV